MKKLFTSFCRLLLIVISITSFIFSQQQPEYEIINLGYNNLCLFPMAMGPAAINDSSEIVINYHDEFEFSSAYLWKNGALTLLPSGGMQPSASDINNNSCFSVNYSTLFPA